MSVSAHRCQSHYISTTPRRFTRIHFEFLTLEEGSDNFYCCAVHYGIYILFTHQQMHFLFNLQSLNLHENTRNYRSYMFRSSTIRRELVQSLAKVKLLHNKQHTRYFKHAATSPHNIQRRNFTECFNRSVTLAKLCTSSLRMVEDRNM